MNVLTDSVFLAINRVRDYLRLNGILLGVAKCTPAVPVGRRRGDGALRLRRRCHRAVRAGQPVGDLPARARAAGRSRRRASCATPGTSPAPATSTYVLTVFPLLVFPLLVINALGSAAGAAYFISFQVVTLLNAVILAVANATYAECERTRHGRHKVVRKGGMTLLVCSVAGALAMFVLAPYFLMIFGEHYVTEGTWTLRVLAFATVGAAFNYWGAIRLRLVGQPERDDRCADAQHRGDAGAGLPARLARAPCGWRPHGASATSWVGRWLRRHRRRSPASPTMPRRPTNGPAPVEDLDEKPPRHHEAPRRGDRAGRAPGRAGAAVPRRPAVPVSCGLGVPGDRGERRRGGPRPAEAVRRPRRLAAGTAAQSRRRLPPWRPTAWSWSRRSVCAAWWPTCAPKRCCSPMASTAARDRSSASRS